MRWRFSCVLGESPKDCGPAALATVAQHYGVRLSLLRLHELLHTDGQGTTIEHLRAGAESIGFSASTGRLKAEHLGQVGLPFIAHLKQEPSGHFVVVHKLSPNFITVADPARGVIRLPKTTFLTSWSSQVVLLRPTARLGGMRGATNPAIAFLQLVASERALLMPSLWFAVVIALTTYASSYFIRQIVDVVIPGANRPLLQSLGLAVTGAVLVRALFGAVRQLLLAHANLRLSTSMGSAFIRHLLALPVRFFDRFQAGDMLARFLDGPKFAAAVSGSILAVLLDTMLLLTSGLFMLAYSVPLTLMAISLVPAYGLLTLSSNNAVRTRERRIRERFSNLANKFVETVTNIRVVKAYTFENGASEQLAACQEQMQEAMLERAKLSVVLSSVSTLLSGGFAIALLWLGTFYVIDKHLSVGELVFFYSVLTLFLGAVDRLTASVPAIQEAAIGLERVLDVHSIPQEHDGCLLGFVKSERGDSIVFEDVSFWYRPGIPVLRNINLEVAAGETIAILGETGCGKSTLISLVNGLYQAQAGHVLVNGRDVRDMDKVALRRRVATVVQEHGLVTGTIRDNIALGVRHSSQENITAAARLASADAFIDNLREGYDFEVGLSGGGLSSGQRQRIAIARALFREPAILILDEATSNLDPETEATIIEALALNSRRRITIIATHRISIAAKVHRIVVLEAGEIVELGSHDALLARQGKYRRMWDTFSPAFVGVRRSDAALRAI